MAQGDPILFSRSIAWSLALGPGLLRGHALADPQASRRVRPAARGALLVRRAGHRQEPELHLPPPRARPGQRLRHAPEPHHVPDVGLHPRDLRLRPGLGRSFATNE